MCKGWKMKKITVVCGHYGSGKTNLAINLAMDSAGEDVTILDMDIVNPYFRSSEYGNLLSEHGISLISPVFANSTLDVPTLPPEMYSVFDSGKTVIVDAGGDDVGARALGGVSGRIIDAGYDMIFVINRYRMLSQTPQEALWLLEEIEAASGLKATGIVNNSHLGVETTEKTVMESLDFAKETAKITGLPLLYSTIPDFAVESDDVHGLAVIKRFVTFPWERENEE